MSNDCTICTFATKKPGGKVGCSEHPEMGKAFKPIDDCATFTPSNSQMVPTNHLIQDDDIPVEERSDNSKEENNNSETGMIQIRIIDIGIDSPGIERTPHMIATEIYAIKGQARNVMLVSSIEIGRRLVEAKAMLSHGEWGDWLKNSVDYSQSTAENLMRIYKEYSSNSDSKIPMLANLSYSKAVALLGLPKEERDQFAEEHDINAMSSRELLQAIKERDQALADKEKADHEKENAIKERDQIKSDAQAADGRITSLITEKDKLMKDLDSADKKVDEETAKLKNDLEKNKKDLDKKKAELERLNSKIKDLETKSLEVKPGATPEEIEKIKSDIASEFEKDKAVLKSEKESAERRVKELEIKVTQQSNAAALRYTVFFEVLTKDFTEILKALSDIKETDAETYDRYKNATMKLISTMTERL
ncbi:MAG: DUF3102 domain-containing protein [Clostridiaceae bacterium]